MNRSLLVAAILAPLLLIGCAHGPDLKDSVQIDNSTGWQIFPGQGYRYGPSIIAYPDNSLDMWFAASCYDGVHWDQIRYRHSPDGGHSWEEPDDQVVITPTDGSPDRYSCCDPGAIRFGGYYYVGYTSVDNKEGQSNHVFLARSEAPRGPYEKWNGSGWGGEPAVFLRYTGEPTKWGCGEPSFVLKDGVLYVYYSWNDGTGSYVDLAICRTPFKENWPAYMETQGHVIVHEAPGEDSVDVKYVDSLHRFVAVATCNRIFSVNATVSVWQSADGVSWERAPFRGDRVRTGAHNIGISGNEIGHIDGDIRPFISYAYGWPGKDFTGQDFGWANWATFIDPIALSAVPKGSPLHIEVGTVLDWEHSGPKAIDGDPDTFYSSAAYPSAASEEWAHVWLGEAYPVAGLKIEPAPGGEGFPRDFALQSSQDGKSWTDIRSFADFPNPGDETVRLNFEQVVTAAYFRLHATRLRESGDGNYYFQIGEIEIVTSR